MQKRIFREQRRLGQYSVQLWFEKEEYPVRRGEVIGATGQQIEDFADAYSASISRTLNTTRSESIETTTVLAAPASSGTIMTSFS